MYMISSTLLRMAPFGLAALALASCHGEGVSMTADQPLALAASSTKPNSPKEARYVKLEALSEWNGQAWTSIAEFNVLDATGAMVDRKGWVATSDSAAASDHAENAIDGDPRTLWHSQWEGVAPPPPHSLTIDLGARVRLSGFRYLARQDKLTNGTIAKYRFYVSDDGANWGVPVAEGDFWQQGAPSVEKIVVFAKQTPNSPPVLTAPSPMTSAFGDSVSLRVAATDPDGDSLQYSAHGLPTGLTIDPKSGVISGTPIAPGVYTVALGVTDKKAPDVTVKFDWIVDAPRLAGNAPATGEARFVKLEEVSAVKNGPWAAVAELNLLDANGTNLPREGWHASADSAATNDQAQNAIDGDPRTLWHSQWDGVAPEPPHSLIIDLRQPMRLSGLRMLPRQDGPTNGTIAKFRVYTSVDGVEWGRPVTEGDFSTMGPPLAEKTVRFQ